MKRGNFERTLSARRGIGDFTENGGGARAGGRRKIRRAAMKCFVGEKGKGESFFRVFRDSKTGGGEHFNWVCKVGRAEARPYKAFASAGTEGGRELREDQGVISAATGNDELMDFGSGENETMQRINHGERRENRRRANEVARLGTMPPAEGEQFF